MINSLFTRLAAVLTVIIVIELIAIFAFAAEGDLALVHADQEQEWYINTRTLVSPAPGTISFWNKIVPAQGSGSALRIQQVLKQAGKDPARAAYMQTLEERDCTTHSSKIWSVLFYDKQDRIIHVGNAAAAMRLVMGTVGKERAAEETVCNMTSQTHDRKFRLAKASDGPGAE